ncbi:TetR/AcrR family transcriptional regulator [Streptomyces chromofuscus]|uniref:TetR/AcrR family transcriptional regulator n=1 Tax=Streptomyces chromofuscus TaxID=42881 RepID=UPI0019A6C51D|nr:TetR/AcrR family transcriptional regulator [Streptomyces chromofuscus]GGT15842.1 TetR family transcriptional regulator [Streptomyces chromofuscus]
MATPGIPAMATPDVESPGRATPSGRAGTKGVPRARRERQILAAATEEFGRRGYEGTSLAAVAARVGVTKTLLHQYFGAKQDLYLACLIPVGDRIVSAVRSAMVDPADGRTAEGDTPADRADETAPPTPLRVLHALFTALEGRREAWLLLYDTSLPADSEAARRARRYRVAVDACAARGAADVLLAAGSYDALDAEALSRAWQGLATALVRWWIDRPDESADAMAERCARLFTAARHALAP